MDLKDIKDEELVKEIERANNFGSRAIQAEIMVRLKGSIDKMSRSTDFYSDRLLDLTILLFLIAFVQLLISFRPLLNSWGQWIIAAIIFSLGMYFILQSMLKDREKREREKSDKK